MSEQTTDTINDEYKLFVIKDFNQPALNGYMYNLKDPGTIKAINDFCNKEVVYGELGHPKFVKNLAIKENIKRCSEIDQEKIAASFKNISFDEKTNQLTALVNISRHNKIETFKMIEDNELIFGMRALIANIDDKLNGGVIDSIITFDLVKGK